MPLDTLDTKSRNIHQFAITEPKKAAVLPFDPQRDMSSKDWAGMKSYYSRLSSGEEHERIASTHVASNIYMLFPNQIGELELKKSWPQVKRDYKKIPQWSGIVESKFAYPSAQLLYPDKYQQIQPDPAYLDSVARGIRWNIHVEEVDEIEDRLSGLYELGILKHFAVPDVLAQIKAPTTEGLKEIFNPSRSVTPELAIALRSFYPDAFESNKDLIPWERYMERLSACKEGHWRFGIPLAEAMSVLAAEEVRIDETGLTINLAPPKLESTTKIEMPERRKF